MGEKGADVSFHSWHASSVIIIIAAAVVVVIVVVVGGVVGVVVVVKMLPSNRQTNKQNLKISFPKKEIPLAFFLFI